MVFVCLFVCLFVLVIVVLLFSSTVNVILSIFLFLIPGKCVINGGLIQYCAKVIQTNFDGIRAVWDRCFSAKISDIFLMEFLFI